jgi:SAM-dependent methyltransferase
MDSVHDKEKEFHDQLFSEDSATREQRVGKYYSVLDSSLNRYRGYLDSYCEEKSVLDYGCGHGLWSFYLAERGAGKVTAIDISEVAIEQAKKRLDFRVMNAEEMEFDDDSFDLICGTAILHHLDLHMAFSQLARTLRPEGHAVFLEPLGHNPLINLYRRFTSELRTEDEHPLRMEDLRLAGEYFERVDADFFHLFALAAVPFRGSRLFKPLLAALNALDQAVFRIFPGLSRFSWMAVITLSRPRK